MKKYLIFFLVVVMAGCATSKGFDREKLKDDIGSGEAAAAMNYGKKAKSEASHLEFPFKLAVCFTNPKTNVKGKEWSWTSEDKKKILSLEKNLKSSNIISEMRVLDGSTYSADDTEAIRKAAANTGSDAVLIVKAISDIDRYSNKYAPSYALFFPLFCVPGTDVDYLVITSASMWDTDTNYLYLSAEAEGLSKETSPELLVKEEDVLESAKNQSLNSLKKAIITHIRNLAGK